MTCDELRDLLHGYVDGELDLVHDLAVERHLEDCTACTATVRQLRELRQALGDAALYHRAPARLQKRISSALRPAPLARLAVPVQAWRWLAIAASVGFLALLAGGTWWLRSLPSREDLVAQEVFSSHMRSLMAPALVDKPSSDQHMVKPWFAGKLDYAPVVKKLEKEGFPLAGGRLDYVANRKVAALVYKRHLHTINLFQWPATTDDDPAPRTLTYQNYQLVHWTRAGTTYWAISDLNAEELREFAALFP